MSNGRKSHRREADGEDLSFSRKKRKALLVKIDMYPGVKKTLATLKEKGDQKSMLAVMRQLRFLEECKGRELTKRQI